jgi:hypothetical protein
MNTFVQDLLDPMDDVSIVRPVTLLLLYFLHSDLPFTVPSASSRRLFDDYNSI